MYKSNLNNRSLRSALLLGAASVAAVGFAAPVSAQESVETVVVTGSRIPQQGLYSSSPVTAVGTQEMKFEGTQSIDSLLNNLPSVLADQTTGQSNGANGTATVDLRGLGTQRTLVLIDGTRLMPGDPVVPVPDLNNIPAALVDHVEVLTGGASAVYGSDAEAGVVNFIMRKDFQGVEVDGQYTVANDDNDNGAIRALIAPHLGDPAHSFSLAKQGILDGGTNDINLVMGTNTADGKGNITVYAGYRNTQAILGSARDYAGCSTSFSGAGKLQCGGSSNFNRFISINNSYASSPSVGANSLAPGGIVDGFINGSGSQHRSGGPGTGTLVPYVGAASQKFNFGGLNYLQRPDTRYTAGYFAHYDIDKHVEIYSSFMFMDDDSVAQVAPSGFFLGQGTVSGTFANVNCSNPLLSAQENQQWCGELPGDALTTVATPSGPHTYWNGAGNGNCSQAPYFIGGCQAGQATLEIGRRNVEGGNRQSDDRHDSYRIQIGAKGDLGDGWSYDVYAQFGQTIFTTATRNYQSIAQSGNAIQVDPTTGNCFSGGACVPLDIFSGIGGVTPAEAAASAADSIQTGYTQERVVSGSLTGDLGQWGIQSPWAKRPVSIALGSEYRQEGISFTPDSSASSGDLSGFGGAAAPLGLKTFNVVEGFGELQVPVIENMPFAEALTLNAGYRYSSYNLAGNVASYKYGAEWQPIDDIRFRASYQRAVRAPNVLELFTPRSTGLFGGNDPCSASKATIDPAVLHNCETAGGVASAQVPFGAIGSGLVQCVASQCSVGTGGSTTVHPEKSDTRSVGIVLTPTFLDGFTATVDYFDIHIGDVLGASGSLPLVALAACYGPTATASSQAASCKFIIRNAVHGINSSGGGITSGYVQDYTTNSGIADNKGFDFEANYSTDMSDWGMNGWGSLSANFVGTVVNRISFAPITGFASYNCAGMYGYTCGNPEPRWRHKLRVTWSSPWDFDISAQWRHVGGVSLDSNTNNPITSPQCGGSQTSPAPCPDPVDAKIPKFDYFDLSGSWNIREGVTLNAGVNNIFDKEPPFIFTGIAGPSELGNSNTFPGVYDTLGRQIFVGGTVKF